MRSRCNSKKPKKYMFNLLLSKLIRPKLVNLCIASYIKLKRVNIECE